MPCSAVRHGLADPVSARQPECRCCLTAMHNWPGLWPLLPAACESFYSPICRLFSRPKQKKYFCYIHLFNPSLGTHCHHFLSIAPEKCALCTASVYPPGLQTDGPLPALVLKAINVLHRELRSVALNLHCVAALVLIELYLQVLTNWSYWSE